MLDTLPLRLRPPGAIPQGIPSVNWQHPLSRGLVAAYTPGISGGYDHVRANNGSSVGSPGFALTPRGLAQSFNGTSQYINIGAPADLEAIYPGTLPFTVSVTFVCPASTGASAFILAKDFSTGARGFGVGVQGTQAYLEVNASVIVKDLGPSVTDNAIHQITVLFNPPYAPTYSVLYADGALISFGSSTTITANSLADWYIGGRAYVGFFNGFPGQVLDIKIWNRNLAATPITNAPQWEITAHAQDPFQLYNFSSDINIGMFGGASAPVASPFFVPNFDLRLNIKINPDLRSFTDDRIINLISSDSVYAGPGQVPAYELKTAPRAPARKDYVKTTDIQLIGQDIIYGSPGQVTSYDNSNPVRRKNIEPISWFQNLLQSTLNIIFFPFAQLDWPNPNRRKNDINKTWRDNSKIQLIGQDTFFGAPGQTKVYDYPNPILRKDDVTKRTWIASLVYGISTTIVLAQQAWNWNKNTYSLIFNYNLAQKAWQWVPNSSIIQYAISLVTKVWQWKGQSLIFSGGNFNKVKRVIQAFMVSINRFMNR